MWLYFKSAVAAALVPGTVVGLLPYLILRPAQLAPLADWRFSHVLAVLCMLAGLLILLTCIWQTAYFGRGTLAPIDEPKSLVVQGLYRFVRNPMYLGVLLILLSETWLFGSMTLLLYTSIWFLVINLIVLFYEEPNLSTKHGGGYRLYCQSVRRWMPGRPYRIPGEEAGIEN